MKWKKIIARTIAFIVLSPLIVPVLIVSLPMAVIVWAIDTAFDNPTGFKFPWS